jgi:hypothetical protein
VAALRARPITLIRGDDELGALHNRLALACRSGDTLVYDELTRAGPEAHRALRAVLEERRGPGDGYLEVHPELRVILTSTPEEHAGVHHPPDSLMDRLITIAMDHHDRETEVAITRARSGIRIDEAEVIVDVVRELRELGLTRQGPSLRACIMIARVTVQQGAHAHVGDEKFTEVCHDVLGSLTAKAIRDGAKGVHPTIDDLLTRHAWKHLHAALVGRGGRWAHCDCAGWVFPRRRAPPATPQLRRATSRTVNASISSSVSKRCRPSHCHSCSRNAGPAAPRRAAASTANARTRCSMFELARARGQRRQLDEIDPEQRHRAAEHRERLRGPDGGAGAAGAAQDDADPRGRGVEVLGRRREVIGQRVVRHHAQRAGRRLLEARDQVGPGDDERPRPEDVIVDPARDPGEVAIAAQDERRAQPGHLADRAQRAIDGASVLGPEAEQHREERAQLGRPPALRDQQHAADLDLVGGLERERGQALSIAVDPVPAPAVAERPGLPLADELGVVARDAPGPVLEDEIAVGRRADAPAIDRRRGELVHLRRPVHPQPRDRVVDRPRPLRVRHLVGHALHRARS